MITSVYSTTACFFRTTVTNGAKRALQIVLDVIRFPARYFGAKIRSNVAVRQATPAETLLLMKHIAVARAVKSGDARWISPLGMHLSGYNYIDIQTGLQVTVAESANEVIVGFGARGWDGGSLKEEKDMATYKNNQLAVLIGNPAGFTPRCYEQASQIFQQIQKGYRGKKISVAGICYGGAVASYVALQNRVEAFCYNSFTLGAGLQQAIGSEKLKMADHLITHLSTDGDVVSDNKLLQCLDRAASFFGIKTPGRFGRRFTIPRVYSGLWDNHVHVWATMMHHLGHALGAKTSDLSEQELQILSS